MRFTKLNYCQYLLSSQINYTITNLADHLESMSHDQINRYLRREKLTPRLLWENVKRLLQITENAYIIFDDTVLDKRYSEDIELTRRQYSGNEHGVLRATKTLMQYIDNLGKYYYCPLKKNRLVDDTGGSEEYKRIESLNWNPSELQPGKIIKIKAFPKDKKVKLFRVTVSTDKTEFVATNDLTQDSTDIVQEVCDIRWKIEEFHREIKQLTGIESCQCRKARIMLPQVYQTCFQSQLSANQCLTLEILVWLLQAHKQVRIERLAALFPQPIKFESRRRRLQRFLILPLISIPVVWSCLSIPTVELGINHSVSEAGR